MDRYAALVEWSKVLHSVDSRPNEARRFLGSRLRVLGDPRHLLPHVDVLEQELVEACAGNRAPERELMEGRRTRGNNHAIQPQLLDLLLDQPLTRVGAHEHLSRGKDHAGELADLVGHPLDIDDVRDVPATVTDEHPDPGAVLMVVATS